MALNSQLEAGGASQSLDPSRALQTAADEQSIHDMAREYFVLALCITKRRWKLMLLPIAIALTLAALAIKFAPTTYVAKSLILLQSANRSAANSYGGGRQAAADQITAIDAWLKSEQVIMGLLPQLVDAKLLTTPADIVLQSVVLRKALTLELVGGSALEMRLEGRSPVGLAAKLEIVIARLMEGLTGPEQSILNAKQFVLVRRNEAVTAAEAALLKTISLASLGPAEKVVAQLRQLSDAQLQQSGRPRQPADGAVGNAAVSPAIQDMRRAISSDTRIVAELERLYAQLNAAQQQADAMRGATGNGRNNSNYVGFFDAPENLLVVGRPQDPITGESSAKKIAIAGILLSLIAGLGMALLAEILDGRLRTERQYATSSGLPIITRTKGGRPQTAPA